MKVRLTLLAAGALAALALGAGAARAASHSDAPLSKQDAHANITDVYAFITPKFNDFQVKVLNVVVHVRPLIDPGDGATFERFADDALYSIHITNPATGATAVRYDFQFSGVSGSAGGSGMFKNLDTILSFGRGTEVGPIQNVDDARHNFTQKYRVTRTAGGTSTVIATDRLTPPPNVGLRTTPFYNDKNGRAVSGATTFAALDRYTQQTIYGLKSGEVVFAGERDDGFYADIAGIFDLLDPRILGTDGRGQTGNGVDFFKGYDVLAYCMQVPVDSLSAVPGFPSVGVYASVSRPQVTLRVPTQQALSLGSFVQVNRMGNPLFNEVLVAIRDKDNYLRAAPTEDATRFVTYAQNPELAVLLNAVFGTTIQANNRTDLVGIFIPDVLRVDTSTPTVRLAGQAGFNRLSVFGGDTTTNAKGATVPSGWPNGRRLGDDVGDIALTALANGPNFTPPILPLGDNINANDIAFHRVFPYTATPHAGPKSSQDSGPER